MKHSFIFALLLLFAVNIYGQNKEKEDFENTQVRFNLNAALELELDPRNDISFNFLTANDIENGVTKSQFARFKIKATRPWTLSVKSLTPYFNSSGPYASQDMPPSVLGIKKSNSSEYTPLAYSDIPLFSGNRGGTLTPGNDFNADIKFTPGFSYAEGYYFITLVYTLTPM
jgi:hypothetical protein